MLRRVLLLSLLFLAPGCGGGREDGAPADERTYSCGSYESLGPGAVTSEPPC